jgi:hypothetical protein
LKTKIGNRQEAVRFNKFNVKAMNWYFDIHENYSWVKHSNTYSVDEGGIMSGFGQLPSGTHTSHDLQLLNNGP